MPIENNLIFVVFVFNFSFFPAFANVWFSLGDLEYQVNLSIVDSYTAAEQACANAYARLATVSTDEIQTSLMNNAGVLTGKPFGFYIGLRNIKGNYTWNDGIQLSGRYSNWEVQSINDTDEKNCVTMGSLGTYDDSLLWHHVRCTELARFICQRPTVCQEPPQVINTELSSSNFPVPVGTRVVYECQPPFKSFGIMENFCKIGGRWNLTDNDLPVCSCPNPPDLENGFHTSTVDAPFIQGDVITYWCNEHYVINGTLFINECLDSGEWSLPVITDDPVCIAECQQPPVIANGRIGGSRPPYYEHEEVIYTCDENFLMEGTSENICLPTGKWELTEEKENLPVCVIISECTESPPTFLSNGKIVGNLSRFAVGAVYQYECDEGFVIDGEASVECLPSGNWEITLPSGSLPTCLKMCNERLNPIRNGALSGTSSAPYKEGDILTYVCDFGFQLSSSANSVQCLPNGSWNTGAKVPTCIQIGCTSPPEFFNATVNGNSSKQNYTAGDTITYTCTEDDSVVTVVECDNNLQWNTSGSSLPVCKAVTRKTDIMIGNHAPLYVIALIVIGLALLILIVIVIIVTVSYRKKRKHQIQHANKSNTRVKKEKEYRNEAFFPDIDEEQNVSVQRKATFY